jgi:hypothetical protein
MLGRVEGNKTSGARAGPGGTVSGNQRQEVEDMARIIVQADDRRAVLLDERNVKPEHFNDEHTAVQLIERLEWAVKDEFRRTKVRRRRTAPPLAESALTRTFD